MASTGIIEGRLQVARNCVKSKINITGNESSSYAGNGALAFA